MSEISVRIAVASHKSYPMPPDPIYLPLQVGAALARDGEGHPLRLGFACDDTGENISDQNPGFCELTALYWEWKNLSEDYLGLVHYRRHFSYGNRKGSSVEDAIRSEELKPLLGQYAVFVPKKRWYVIETLYSHYAHTHYAGHLDMTREIIRERSPRYLASFDRTMRETKGYMFNMMIMRRDFLDRYCTWLFDTLFELKKRIEAEGSAADLDSYQGRLYGRVSELLLNVWLDEEIMSGEMPESGILELPYFGTEKTDWVKKGGAFVKAKVLHRKYEGSF